MSESSPSPEELAVPDDVLEQVLPDADPVEEPVAPEAEPAVPVTFEELAVQMGLDLPDDPEEQRVVLIGALAVARQEAGEYLETLQRVAAEFENYRRRVERDQAEMVERASERILESLLPALDNFEAALAYEPQAPGEEKILDGMRGTHTSLMETLANAGLLPVATGDVPFDPAVHEAVSGPTGESDGDLVVAQTLRKGYTLHGRVVRPALVTVEHG